MLEPMETLADGEQRKTLANSEERDCAGGFQSSSLMKAARFGQVDAIERALEVRCGAAAGRLRKAMSRLLCRGSLPGAR